MFPPLEHFTDIYDNAVTLNMRLACIVGILSTSSAYVSAASDVMSFSSLATRHDPHRFRSFCRILLTALPPTLCEVDPARLRFAPRLALRVLAGLRFLTEHCHRVLVHVPLLI